MRTIGVGLIGYGLGGRAFHAPYVGVTPGLALRAVVSRSPDTVAADLPDVPVVPSVEALLRRSDIDLAIVCSPDALHAKHALACLGAGKDVLVDKPFATTLADARRVLAAAEASGRMLSVFHNRRWDADFLTLRDLVDGGTLGDIVHLESRLDRWRPAPAKSWKEARAGGSWLDLGPHLVDQALVLFGVPAAVTADLASLRAGTPAPDWFHVVLRYPKRRVVLQSSKLAADHRLRFAVHGTRGSWIKHGIDPQEAAAVAGRRPGEEGWGVDAEPGLLTLGSNMISQPWANRRGDYRLFWQDLAAALRGGGPNPVPPAEALAVMEVLDAGLRSATERREIML